MDKIFEQWTIDGELTPELIKRKQELDQAMEVELAEVDAGRGQQWVPKPRQYADIQNKYAELWEQELTDAGYLVRPVFESWYDELSRLNQSRLRESEEAPVLRTFGRKTYNLANMDELDAWFKANFEFQQQRYPGKYRTAGSINSKWLKLRASIARNLLTSLQAEGVTNPQIIDRLERITNTGTKLSRAFTKDELDTLFAEFAISLSARYNAKEMQTINKDLDALKQKLLNREL